MCNSFSLGVIAALETYSALACGSCVNVFLYCSKDPLCVLVPQITIFVLYFKSFKENMQQIFTPLETLD